MFGLLTEMIYHGVTEIQRKKRRSILAQRRKDAEREEKGRDLSRWYGGDEDLQIADYKLQKVFLLPKLGI